MNYLAIDYGDKRIGLAGSDSGVLAQPLEIMQLHTDSDKDTLLDKITSKYQPETIILGMPVNEDGTFGPQADRVINFKNEITKKYPRIKVVSVNEFLTSFEAKERAGRKIGQPYDDYAALIILEQFLNQTA